MTTPSTVRHAACAAAFIACAQAPALAAPAVYEARGQEPGWHLRLEGRAASLTTMDGGTRRASASPARKTRNGRSYRLDFSGEPARVSVENRVCRDAMSGMPHPDRVTITGLGAPLRGCGGSPRALLGTAEWAVVEIAGKRVLPGSKPSLQFFDESGVGGNGSCNRFRAGYRLTGEGLRIDKAASTMMACDEGLMRQEHALLRQLEATVAFDIRRDGALLLKAADGSGLVAKRKR